jgi:hypothetical protein
LILHHVTLCDHHVVLIRGSSRTIVTGFLFKRTSVSVTTTDARAVALLTDCLSSNLVIVLVKR